jgi:hypothetical protein
MGNEFSLRKSTIHYNLCWSEFLFKICFNHIIIIIIIIIIGGHRFHKLFKDFGLSTTYITNIAFFVHVLVWSIKS